MKWDKEIKWKLRSIIEGKIREIRDQVRDLPERDRWMAFDDAWGRFRKSHGIIKVCSHSDFYCGYCANDRDSSLQEIIHQGHTKGKRIVVKDPEVNEKGHHLSIPKDVAKKMLVLGYLP